MASARTIQLSSIPAPLLSHLESRDAVVWVLDSFAAEAGAEQVASVLRLPWRLALSESSEPRLISELERTDDPEDPLVRQRGFVHVVDSNPAELLLPPRCLPVYLLNGRGEAASLTGLAALTRRFTMLDTLRRMEPRELILLLGRDSTLPKELAELWHDGLRTVVTVVSDSPTIAAELEEWVDANEIAAAVAYHPLAAGKFCKELVDAHFAGRESQRINVRIRDSHGVARTYDVTALDDPERPLLANYDILHERDLRRLQPEDLTLEQIQDFFQDAASAWRPYAAGMPWPRDDQHWQRLRSRLRRLDRDGSEANRVAFIAAESGAGGTTLLRNLAWIAAEEGYPTLVAKSAPFAPKALEMANFMTRVMEIQRLSVVETGGERLYEAPWLVAFDRMHWQGREADLRQFLRELEKSGRPACIIIVTGPYLGVEYYDDRHFLALGMLSHELTLGETIALGNHLNRYLAPHGPVRSEYEWRNFYEATSVQSGQGIAAFWISLSFWLQRQFDMQETVQSWIYRQFKENVHEDDIKSAMLSIAALSTERYPLPDAMLPATADWPMSQKIEDKRKDVPGLCLVRISREGDRYWALVHNIIGRYLLTALFYDFPSRVAAGFEDAMNPEHLRFLALRRLSRTPALAGC
ncbi:hypothetical protein SAMN06265365_104292 [Tistlia consotensis]|uniref:Inactive Sirtuin domain-containing protein n=1 Tax=Tistlia consotensis USBA 355 TaxID=560819 RepID=A0A1Y6BT99_9PROT|nr:hypothetical protein [Tistlia consotensis]SMF20244.1 hypothetical protein SAMN05428998_1072 [Tistlia consotensis USBA 355]SNR48031.1 hypothetical protein SAMN06265365_104292 [Tistlia consotensis]